MAKRDFTVIEGGKPAPKQPKSKPRDVALSHLQQAIEHLQSALDTGVRGHLRSSIEDALEAAQAATAPKPKTFTDLSYEALKPGKEASDELAKKISDAVCTEIGKIAKPRKVWIVTDMPKTRSGKIMRRVLGAISNDKDVGDVTTLANPDIVEEIKKMAKG